MARSARLTLLRAGSTWALEVGEECASLHILQRDMRFLSSHMASKNGQQGPTSGTSSRRLTLVRSQQLPEMMRPLLLLTYRQEHDIEP